MDEISRAYLGLRDVSFQLARGRRWGSLLERSGKSTLLRLIGVPDGPTRAASTCTAGSARCSTSGQGFIPIDRP